MNRCQFANLPTPIQHLQRVGESLGFPHLYIKRDDLIGLSFGGNKTRKLEYVIAEALEQQVDVIVSIGGIQSNHVRQTAAVCAKVGIPCRLILTNDESETPPSGNLFLNHLFGAQVIFCDKDKLDLTIVAEMDSIKNNGQKGMFIPLGASTPIGAMGYKTAFDELMDQDPGFDWIILASGSGGTQAGLLHAAERSTWKGNIYGVSILFEQSVLMACIKQILSGMEGLTGIAATNRKELIVDGNFLGGGYGVMSDLESHAIHLFAEKEGILLDPVYTGRAAGAMLQLMREGVFMPQQRILFWHTGGTPALFCEKYRTKLIA